MQTFLAIPDVIFGLVIMRAVIAGITEKDIPTRKGDRWVALYVVAFPGFLMVQVIGYAVRRDWPISVEALVVLSVVLPICARMLVTRQRRWNRYRDSQRG